MCTNARRDVCCAVRGRPVALEAAAARPGQVWECSHTGGHRFAPTAVVLPHGQTWARLTPELAVDRPRRRRPAAGCRRRCSARCTTAAAASCPHPPRPRSPSSATGSGEVDLDRALGRGRAGRRRARPRGRCTVTHRDGRSWDVLATRASGHGERPDSCGKAPVPTLQWDCTPA